VLTVEDWAEIRRLHRVEQLPVKAIVRRLGVSRNAVRRALARDVPPRYVRAPAGSIVDEVEPQIRALLKVTPDMPSTVVAERIGWDRSLTVLRDRVRVLRPYYLPPDPASRTAYRPGERMQCDLWFPPVDIALGHGQVGRPPVLVMVSGYSRMIFAMMIPSRQSADLIAGHWDLLGRIGALPRELVWDNESAVGSWRAGKPKLAQEFEAFRGALGIGVHQCRPRDPEAKGLVERVNGYFETSFLPGRVFTGPGDFNAQLAGWLVLANGRHHRRIGCAPSARWVTDRGAMLGLPPAAPTIGWRADVRLPRDYYVRLDSNDYSVDPAVIGRRVAISADLDTVRVRQDGRLVAEHQRCWAKHQSITDPGHQEAALAMQAKPKASAPAPAGGDIEQRDLGAYDAAFGLSGQEVA
jgi:transposase